jgi:hypothetical protein
MSRAREGCMGLHRWSAVLIGMALLPAIVRAQGTSGPSSSDSRVGYIDNAIPGNIFRLRFDDNTDDRRPTRAEFIYPQGAPNGPGLPRPDPSIDFQELTAYMEYAPVARFSVFLELPVRFLEPTVNAREAGLSDLNTGFKWAFVRTADTVTTLQFRVYAPTGDSQRGLGTNHVSVEPALLAYHRVTSRLAAEAEFRTWVPVGGTDFAGDIVRYGAGVHYDLCQLGSVSLAPVAEVVGWTVLNGKTAVVPPDGVPFVEDAGGQTIVNVKLGLRTRFGNRVDLYTGYGRPITGNRWYENTIRVELRVLY